MDDEEAQVNARAEEDLNLENIEGDLVVGPIEAGGTATITGDGSIIAGDKLGEDAQVKAESIDLTAKDGHIGTSDEAFLVDTDSDNGTLSADGNYINIEELTGDVTLKDIESDTDATITVPGSILDGNADAIDEAV